MENTPNSGEQSSNTRIGLLGQTSRLVNTRQGLLNQARELLQPSRMGSAFSAGRNISEEPSSASAGQTPNRLLISSGTSKNNSNTSSSLASSTGNIPSTALSISKSSSICNQKSNANTSTKSSNNPSISTNKSNIVPNDEVVRDLKTSLCSIQLLSEFRLFLRTKIDRNRSSDSEFKKMSEQWLDFVIICEKVFELPEDKREEKIFLMVEIWHKFLEKPPEGYNMALQNQLNRKELINHCKNLSESITDEPDDSLLRDGYEYIFSKLDQKHDVFKKTQRPVTTLAAFMCALS